MNELMEIYLNPEEHRLLMVCKGKIFDEMEEVEVNGVLKDYPEFMSYYIWRYWAGEGEMPYEDSEVLTVLITKMNELLYKLSPALLMRCIDDTFGLASLGAGKILNPYEGQEKLFVALRHYLRLRINRDDYSLLEKGKNE